MPYSPSTNLPVKNSMIMTSLVDGVGIQNYSSCVGKGTQSLFITEQRLGCLGEWYSAEIYASLLLCFPSNITWLGPGRSHCQPQKINCLSYAVIPSHGRTPAFSYSSGLYFAAKCFRVGIVSTFNIDVELILCRKLNEIQIFKNVLAENEEFMTRICVKYNMFTICSLITICIYSCFCGSSPYSRGERM